MSDAEREEMYLQKMLNRGKDKESAKKYVFGGGLEAARAKQEGSIKTVTTPIAPKKLPSAALRTQHLPRSDYVPPLESEVVELSVPYNPKGKNNNSEISEESLVISSLPSDEAMRREEERVAKSIGRFAIQPKSNPTLQSQVSSYSGSNVESLPYSQPKDQSHLTKYTPSNPPSTNLQTTRPGVYSEIQIGSLKPTENSVTILPITFLSCNVNDLQLKVKHNGKQIELHRFNQKGTSEIKHINLPYQVSMDMTSAIYNPNINGGQLNIQFGSPTSAITSETEIARFTVPGSPSSSQTRVQISVNQTTDYFKFFPDKPSSYDTDFTVVLINSTLEFRSTSIQEGKKTVNAKQTVHLPLSPYMDQIDVEGDVITIWINRQGNNQKNIQDFDVSIQVAY